MPLTVLPGQNKSVESNPPIVPNVANLKKKRISWKNIVIGVVGGTILVAAVLGGWFWYQLDQINKSTSNSSTQTTTKTATPSAKTATSSAEPAETAGWKTYNNTDFGFAIKYPPNVKEFSCFNTGCNQFETTLPKGSKIRVIPFTNNVAVPSINSSKSLVEWVETKSPNGIYEGTQYTETINGLSSEIVITDTPDEGIFLVGSPIHQKIAFIYKETKQNRDYTSYIISHYDKSETQNFVDDDKIFDQMLPTFKFL